MVTVAASADGRDGLAGGGEGKREVVAARRTVDVHHFACEVKVGDEP